MIITQEWLDARKKQFIEEAKEVILARLRPIIEYQVRSKICPWTITDEQELNQYYLDQKVSDSAEKPYPFKSLSEWNNENE